MSFYLNLSLEVPSEASMTSLFVNFLVKFSFSSLGFWERWRKTPKNTPELCVTWVFTKRLKIHNSDETNSKLFRRNEAVKTYS